MLGMIGKKDKSIGSLIIARMNPSGSVEKTGEQERQSDYSSAHEACCEEIFSAFESGDKKGFISSMKNMINMMIDEREMTEE